jgi:hypothetical protein
MSAAEQTISDSDRTEATMLDRPRQISRKATRLGGLLVACLLGLFALPSAASAELLSDFTAEVRNQDGSPFTQAGGHPYEAFTDINFHTHLENGQEVPDESVRTIETDLPAGLVGNPQATPQCTRDELTTGFGGGCPINTQVGIAVLKTGLGLNVTAPVYNLVPPEGVPAQFGFIALIPPVYITASVRPDGGLSVRIPNNSQALPLTGTSLTFWGVPADPAHDPDRGQCLNNPDQTVLCPTQAPLLPFLTNPTSCTGPVTTTLRANSWQNGAFETLTSTTPVGADGCEDVPFDPAIDVQSAQSAASTPSGLSVDVTIPQPQNPTGIAQAHLRAAEVTLPEGTAINPAVADGVVGCTEAQIGLDNTADPGCPNASKIGNVEIATPLQPDPLTGGIFLATPNQNPFDSLTAIYLVAQGGGTTIKLAGEIERDPTTGQLKTTIADAPQLPFTAFSLDFKGGSRAPLVTPTTCGTKTASASLTPWSGNPPTELTDSFEITSGPGGSACVATEAQRPFAPTLAAGLQNPAAGSQSPFTLAVSRADQSQEISSIDATLPEGVSAVLASAAQCGEAAAAAGTCGGEALVGSASVKAGAGPNPYQITGGRIYLAGPYKGAPLSLSIVVPARAGIFDLGTVVVRAAVFVDPTDAHLRVVSDPIPRILDGIPLKVRQIALAIDRPGFMTSPTNCDPKQVSAAVTGAFGGAANLSQHFQMAGCERLGFAPQMKTNLLGGKPATKRSANPGLETVLTTRAGDANIDRVALRLPKAIFLDQDNIASICTREQYAAEQCPESSIYGTAVAQTPLLGSPLQGNVYLRSSENPLPDLVADLNGQVSIDLVGRIDTVNGALRTTFDVIPDVPISDFNLKLNEGGLLVNSKNLCKKQKKAKKGKGKRKTYRSKVEITGQNGAGADQKPKLKTACGKKRR